MTEIGLLKEAGAVAFTDGDRTVANARVMRRALAYAATFGALVVGHAEDPELTESASHHRKRIRHPDGAARRARLGRGDHCRARHPPGRADRRALSFRPDFHPRRLDAIAAAKARGLPITCGVSAHHLMLNELDVGPYYTFRKVKPPLRTEADRAAMVEGVASGVIDVIVSSHEPQGADTKRQPFGAAAFGSVGLETLLPAALSLYHDGHATLSHVLKAVTATPARILGLNAGTLGKGAPADLVLLDEAEPFVLDGRTLHSRAHNSAFEGRKFQGRARMTFVGGVACSPDRFDFKSLSSSTVMIAPLPLTAALDALAIGYFLGAIPFGLLFSYLAGAGVRAVALVEESKKLGRHGLSPEPSPGRRQFTADGPIQARCASKLQRVRGRLRRRRTTFHDRRRARRPRSQRRRRPPKRLQRRTGGLDCRAHPRRRPRPSTQPAVRGG